MPSELAITVLASEAELFRSLVTQLEVSGLRGATSSTRFDPLQPLPSLYLLAGLDRADFIDEIRGHEACEHACIVVACDPTEDASGFLALGADDILWLDSGHQATHLRMLQAAKQASSRREFGELQRFHRGLMDMRALIAERGDGAEVLREILIMAADALGFERASMMAHVEASDVAYVLATTDDPTLSEFELAIRDYPEVRAAIHSGAPLLIGDVREHPATARVADDLVSHGVAAIAVFPVAWKGRSMGALLFRKSTSGVAYICAHGQDFGALLAAQLAAQLRDSSLFDRLRDQGRRLTRAGFEAERRAEGIDSLSDYFEASSDGIFVADKEGVLLYANGTAERLTGKVRDALLGTPITDHLPQDDGENIAAVMGLVLDGSNIEPHDMQLRTEEECRTVRVTTSTVLGRLGAVILSFRDVSEQRSLEAQLHRSSEFLSNLVDSAVDAIIAVDIRGLVVVFNKGAERLFGYRASEVVGQLNVTELYPEGVASQVMRMLRSEGYGGPGRLEQICREVLVNGGDIVPVNMTASIIFQHGEEVATVGIFSDLRDRIRIEQRLLVVQEQLKNQEQRSLLAGLAGAAAHELNQPLTSIIGYAQLIERTADLQEKHLRYTKTIVDEAERMAEIVKKIGRITHYETVAYVGSSSIVDLDRSVEASESAPIPALLLTDDSDSTAQITLEQIAESHEEEMRERDPERVRHSDKDSKGR
ncbi:MAG: PAS domain S-box protein [Myxococcales bacterium]|nr:PAS domain S-box protein [Myxococcales bacterium]